MNLAESNIIQLLIPIDDFDRGVAFYRDVLGLPLLFTAPPQMAFFQCGAVRLFVAVTPAGQKAQRGSQIYFAVKDIQAVHSSLSNQGVQFKVPPHLVNRPRCPVDTWPACFLAPFMIRILWELASPESTRG